MSRKVIPVKLVRWTRKNSGLMDQGKKLGMDIKKEKKEEEKLEEKGRT